MPDNSFDSIVTDPPYELGFMGKSWDASGIAYNVEMWREALRVLKPGGHLLAFSGSRTYHRMTCAIEDAGFEIRDQIMWVYGSGFPKSLDVSKAIDKAAGAEREVIGQRESQGGRSGGNNEFSDTLNQSKQIDITAPATDAARQWDGWGTALKPAHEPICVARKPLQGTVAANVLAHGTGALNIDGCRVGSEQRSYEPKGTSASAAMIRVPEHRAGKAGDEVTVTGRWPANLIHDGGDEVLAAFPDAKGQQGATAERQQGALYGAVSPGEVGIEPRIDPDTSAARFFYCAKASKADRGPGNTHPTVKPLALLRYLLRLVTPPGGRALDPFLGSGSTIVAGLQEGFDVTGIELLDEHADIAERRAYLEEFGDLLGDVA
jgi:site-specific DNA-methyltransferase (adenine-specific)